MQLQTQNKIFQNFLIFLCILPAILTGSLIVKYGVNVLFLDQLGVANYIYQFFTFFHITPQNWIAQHNESRLLFPRMIFIGLASLTRWDVRYEMFTMFFMACLISINIYRLNKLTVGGNLTRLLIIVLISNILIFSPVQYENWLWGIQLIVFIPILCITSCILISYSSMTAREKFFVCILLSTISTFSYANGLLCWIVVSPVLALNTLSDLKSKKWLGLAWILAFIFNITVYFYNYQKPTHHPGFSYAVTHPIQSINYFLSFLGSPLAFGKFNTAKLVGLALITIFTCICIYLFKFRRERTLWYKMIGWLMIASYTISSAFITTGGRVGFGISQSLSPRYTTFSLYLTIALIPLVVITTDDFIKKGFLINYKRWFKTIIFLLCAYLIFLQIISSISAVKQMNVWRTERLQGKSCLLLINIVQEKECLATKVNPNVDRVKFFANGLNYLKFINPALIKSSNIKEIEGIPQLMPDRYGYGWFDNLQKERENTFNAMGWSRLPYKEEPADAVILTYENRQGEDIIFALSDSRTERQDVANVTKKQAYSMSGWQKVFSADSLPKSNLKISAWAFDAERGKAYKLNGLHILKNS